MENTYRKRMGINDAQLSHQGQPLEQFPRTKGVYLGLLLTERCDRGHENAQLGYPFPDRDTVSIGCFMSHFSS